VIDPEADGRTPASALANDLRACDFCDEGISIVEWPLCEDRQKHIPLCIRQRSWNRRPGGAERIV